MIAWTLLASWTLSAPAIDCSPVRPAATPDPAAAGAYLEVGEEELRHGRPETAAVALREAARLDPASARARARLLEVCHPASLADDAFERAVRAVEDGRYEEAVALLGARYRAQPEPDPATALLHGIALYERGDDEDARAALERARKAPETADLAAVFLGLVALREGDSERAATFFERIDSGARGELARTARDLSILARREGRLAVSVEAASGYDNNVDLAPDGTPGTWLSGDFLYGASASALVRPFGERGPYAGAGARLRNLVEIRGYNLNWGGGSAGYRFGHGPNAVKVEYAYDVLWLGGTPLLSAHQIQVDGRLELARARWRTLVSARAETYLTQEAARYSGPTLDAEVSTRLGNNGGNELWLGYRGEYHDSADNSLSWLDHGPGARAVAAFAAGRLVGSVQLTARAYQAPDPGFGGAVRRDVYVHGALSFEQDLDRQITLFLSFDGRKAFSNVSGLEYTRLSGVLGLIFTAGLW